MLYILVGTDEYSRHEAFEAIKSGLGDVSMLSANTTVLDGLSVTPEQLKVVVETVPFLADNRLVIVNGLLERFAPGGRTKGKTKSDDPQAFITALGHVPPSTVVVLLDNLEVKINRDTQQADINSVGSPLLKELAKVGQTKLFPKLPKVHVNRWIQERVSKAGGTISPTAVALLFDLVGNDLWMMANEIDKLIAFAAGRRIEDADVRALVSSSRERSVFDLVDAVMLNRGDLAQKLMQQLLMDGDAPGHLLTMLARQLQFFVRAKDLKSRGKSDSEIQSVLKIGQSWQVRKVTEQAGRYSMPRLKEIYEKLLETDLTIKTGKLEPELALDLLVAELCLQKAK